jgi:hypothetical protein
MQDTRLHRRLQSRYVAELARSGTLALDSQVDLMDHGVSMDNFERVTAYEVKAFPHMELIAI